MGPKSTILRTLLAQGPIVRTVGAHNGLGAKLIQRHGFHGVWASGLEISTSHAVPDANILTMTECLEAARIINDATTLPVICDCDTGFGNATQVIHMVHRYEAAGLAAVVIEDKRFPKSNSLLATRQELVPTEEFVGKIEAAKNAQSGSEFMVFARVEALIAGWPMEEALRRAAAYEAAGADGIVIHSKSATPEEIFTFAQRWQGKVPLVAIPTTYYQVTADELAQHGFRMVIYANHALRASIRAMDRTLQTIHQTGSTASIEGELATLSEVFEIQGLAELTQTEKKFLKRKNVAAVIPAARDHRFQPDLKELLQDQPLCMLDLGGKSLLERQMDLMRSCGIDNLCVIGGHLHDRIRAPGAHILYNPDYAFGHCAQSILMAREQMKEGSIVIYSDILFDRQILERLLASPYSITLVIDRAYQKLPFRDKTLDRVCVEESETPPSGRQLRWSPFKSIRSIGKKNLQGTASHEFIGMVYFQKSGVDALVQAWDRAQQEFKQRRFYEAASVLQADLTDMLQYLVDQSVPVMGIEIETGWSEIHSLEDYRRALSYFQEPSTIVTKETLR